MMKMATNEGSPSGRVPEQGPERFLVATKDCGGGTPDLISILEFLGTWIYIGGMSTSMEQQGAHEGGGRAWWGWARPLPRGLLFLFLM